MRSAAGGTLRELPLDARDPVPRAIEQFVLVVHEPAARHHDPEVGARVAVLPAAGDPQVEGLGLVGDGVPVGVAPRERDAAVAVHPPDARRGRLGDQLHGLVGLLQDELRPLVEVAGCAQRSFSSSTSIS